MKTNNKVLQGLFDETFNITKLPKFAESFLRYKVSQGVLKNSEVNELASTLVLHLLDPSRKYSTTNRLLSQEQGPHLKRDVEKDAEQWAQSMFTPTKPSSKLPIDSEIHNIMAPVRQDILRKYIHSVEDWNPTAKSSEARTSVNSKGDVFLAHAQGLFNNQELRKGIKGSVRSKELRRELYKYVPRAKGKLPIKEPLGFLDEELQAGVKTVVDYLKKKGDKQTFPLDF